SGDKIAAIAIDAAGRTAAGAPIFQLGKNVFEVARGSSVSDTLESLETFIAGQSPKGPVVDFSAGPEACDPLYLPDLSSTDDKKRADSRAACMASDFAFYQTIDQGIVPALFDA